MPARAINLENLNIKSVLWTNTVYDSSMPNISAITLVNAKEFPRPLHWSAYGLI